MSNNTQSNCKNCIFSLLEGVKVICLRANSPNQYKEVNGDNTCKEFRNKNKYDNPEKNK